MLDTLLAKVIGTKKDSRLTRLTRLGLAVLAISGVFPLLAELSTLHPAHHLVNQSDAIVVATVRSAILIGTDVQLQLDIQRVAKGNLQPGSTLAALWRSPSPVQDLSRLSVQAKHLESTRALLFLKTDSLGRFLIVPAVSGSRTEPTETLLTNPSNQAVAALSRDPADSDLDVVYRELAATGAEGNQAALASLVESAIGLSRKPAVTRSVAAQLVAAKSRDARAAGMQILLSLGDATGVSMILLREDEWFVDWKGSQISQTVQTYFANSDPAVIDVLGAALQQAKHRELRIACAAALARVHSKATLPYLASLLDNVDPGLIAYGVDGLAAFANNLAIGGHSPQAGQWPYRSKETIAHSGMSERLIVENGNYYVSFWRDWWSRNRSRLSTPGPQ